MEHERLKKAIDSVWNNGCVIYRTHFSNGTTWIEVFNPFWECMLHEQFSTGATDAQCEYIEKTMSQWLGKPTKEV